MYFFPLMKTSRSAGTSEYTSTSRLRRAGIDAPAGGAPSAVPGSVPGRAAGPAGGAVTSTPGRGSTAGSDPPGAVGAPWTRGVRGSGEACGSGAGWAGGAGPVGAGGACPAGAGGAGAGGADTGGAGACARGPAPGGVARGDAFGRSRARAGG